MKGKELNKEEYIPYFQPYIDRIGDMFLVDGLVKGLKDTTSFIDSIPDHKLEFRYAEGKWTIKEIINHLIDSERVFAYRAMRFARKDKTPLSGFEENDYTIESYANNRSIKDLMEEYTALRQATITLFKTFNSDILQRKGVAGSGVVSVRALGFLIAGHEKHHCQVIQERYL